MAKIVNAKMFAKIPNIPSNLAKHLGFNPTCDIAQDLCNLFTTCVSKISDQMQDEGLFKNLQELRYANCVITDTDTTSLQLNDKESAFVVTLIIYPVHRWNEYDDMTKCALILEELCHHFWNIRSEYHVCYKVLEVTKRIYPSVKMEDIYNVKRLQELYTQENQFISNCDEVHHS